MTPPPAAQPVAQPVALTGAPTSAPPVGPPPGYPANYPTGPVRTPFSGPTEGFSDDDEHNNEHFLVHPMEDVAGRPEIERLLSGLVFNGGSDLHIAAAEVPRYRMAGSLLPIGGEAPMSNEEVEALLAEALAPQAWDEFLRLGDVDTSYSMDEALGAAVTSRFRVNVHRTMGKTSAVLRVIPTKIVSLDLLGIPQQIKDMAKKRQGLVLFIGPTGSGKALALDTPIPTPHGTTTMGELKVGSWVLASDGSPCQVTDLSPINDAPELYRVTLSDGQKIVADVDHQWLVSTHHGRNVPRTRKRQKAIARHDNALLDADAIEELAYAVANDPDAPQAMTLKELHALLAREKLDSEFPSHVAVYNAMRMTDCPHQVRAGTTKTSEYPTAIALKSAATRLRERFDNRPSDKADLSRMSTGEMLAAGLRLAPGHARFAIPVADSLTLPHAQLLIPPYIFGAWLGDGNSDSGRITIGQQDYQETVAHLESEWGAEIAVRETGDGRNFHAALRRPVLTACLRGHVSPRRTYTLATGEGVARCRECDGLGDTAPTNGSLGERLAFLGLRNNKQIPQAYLRAAFGQRLALLQGLMDTDGTVSPDGACEISLSNKALAADALELIRSLGIKASVTWDQPASYRDAATGDLVTCKPRHRIHFTTDQPVFRLRRKLNRLPDAGTLAETSKWLYITDIEPIGPGDSDYGPVRCISVDSWDHTYLCGDGFAVTSNSTTLAGLVDLINETRDQRIFTLEDPIEFVHYSKKCMVTHREIGEDTPTFVEGMRRVRRQDPDIILVGEMRDQETIEAAIEAANTGHLVLSTLHANTAPDTILRIINAFPPGRQEEIKQTLSQTLLCVVAQTLVKAPKTERGRIVACEILMVNGAVQSMIREGDIPGLKTEMTNQSYGNITMDAALADLVNRGVVTKRAALEHARNEKSFESFLSNAKGS